MPRKPKPASVSKVWMVAAGVFVLVAAIIGLSTMASRPKGPEGPEGSPAPQSAEAPNIRGKATARVTLVEYGDYK